MNRYSKKSRTNLYRASRGSLVPNMMLVFFILVMLVATGTNSQAQSNALYIQGGGGLVSVSGYDGINPTLFVDGTINLATSGATLTNTLGYIQVKGDVTNSSGTFTSTGTEKFSGSGNQTVSGSFTGTNYFGDVIKANTGNIIFSSNADVNSLVFSADGTLDLTSGTTVYIKSSAFNAITGYTPVRYFDVSTTGFLKRSMSDITSGNWYVFPLGNSSAGYQRVDINLTGGVSGAGDVTATLKSGAGSISILKHYTTGFPGVFSTSCTPGSSGQWVSLDCIQSSYWGFSGPTTHTYVVRTYTAGCGSRINRVLQGTPSTWATNFASTAGSDVCGNSTWSTSSPVLGGTYTGYTGLGLVGGSTIALPVKLVEFTAGAINNSYIRTQWLTASEISNKGFHLMRSTDAATWEKISFIPSKADGGNSTGTLSYFYDDHAVSSNKVYYYQLIQEDLDGKQTLTDVASASISNNKISSMVCYPNPSSGMVTLGITLKEESSPVTIRITDMLGQVVYSEDLMVSENTLKKMIHLNESGQYQIQVTTFDEVFTQKVIILTK